jgi:transcriptional regulator with XRE-family HTH domain
MPSRASTAAARTAELLKRARLDRGLTQMQAALAAKTHNTAWSRMENGVMPAPETLADYAYAVGVTPAELADVGQSKAAARLAARMERTHLRAVDNDGSSPEGRMEALLRVQVYLSEHGWSVSLRANGDAGYVLQVSPQGSLFVLTYSQLTHEGQGTHVGNKLAK